MLSRLEGWGFRCLFGCLLAVILSASLLTGSWQTVGYGLGVVLGILSGGLYSASGSTRGRMGDSSTGAHDGRKR